jgi:hypothetical protein
MDWVRLWLGVLVKRASIQDVAWARGAAGGELYFESGMGTRSIESDNTLAGATQLNREQAWINHKRQCPNAKNREITIW